MKLPRQIESQVVIVKRGLGTDKSLSPPGWHPWRGCALHGTPLAGQSSLQRVVLFGGHNSGHLMPVCAALSSE